MSPYVSPMSPLCLRYDYAPLTLLSAYIYYVYISYRPFAVWRRKGKSVSLQKNSDMMKKDYVVTSDGSYAYRYPRAAVTADAVVLFKEPAGWQVLLIRRGGEPYRGSWALPGGFMNMDETTEACARRELEEETTLRLCAPMRFVGLYDTVGRDPRGRVITATYMCVLERRPEARGSDDAAEARWWPLDDLPELAFDHAKMLARVKEMVDGR